MTGQGDEIGFHRQDNCHLFTGQATISLLFLHSQFAIKIETTAWDYHLQLSYPSYQFRSTPLKIKYGKQ